MAEHYKIILTDQSDTPRIILSVDPDGASTLTIYDAAGKTRLLHTLSADGEANMMIREPEEAESSEKAHTTFTPKPDADLADRFSLN